MVLKLKWLGHAAFQIKTSNKIIYIDLEANSKTFEKGDIVLVTHSHLDHCNSQIIKKTLKPETIIIAPVDCVLKIDREIRVVRSGDIIKINNIIVKAVDAYNYKRFRSPGEPFHPKGKGVGFLINVEGKTIYHAGDTDFITEMKNLGTVNLALLPTGGTYTMDNKDAVEAALAIKPKLVIPMHRMNTEPEEFKNSVEVNSKIKILILNEREEIQI